jgi:hypothetical protein
MSGLLVVALDVEAPDERWRRQMPWADQCSIRQLTDCSGWYEHQKPVRIEFRR